MTGLHAALAALAAEWRSSTTGHPACAHDEDCVGCAADELDALLAKHRADPKPITMHTGSHNPEPSDRAGYQPCNHECNGCPTCDPGLTSDRAGLSEAEREALGRRVREVWVEWAREHPNPKPSWLVPWEGLSEPDKEVDRRIGEVLYAMGAARLAVVEQERDEARAVTQQGEAKKGRLWEHLRNRCAAAEQEVATLRAQIQRLSERTASDLLEAEQEAATLRAECEKWRGRANGNRGGHLYDRVVAERDALRAQVAAVVQWSETRLRGLLHDNGVRRRQADELEADLRHAVTAALGDPGPVVQRVKDEAAATALEQAAEAVWSDAAVEWKWSREEYRTWLRERARRVREGGDHG